MSFLVSFDGPKAVGKTTLIQLVQGLLVAAGHKVEKLVEKELLSPAARDQLGVLYKRFRAAPTAPADQAIADVLRAARVEISARHLALYDGIILLDRWYPSDTVFRRFLESDALVSSNIAAGARVPDLIVALLCAPEVSWERAQRRERCLDSKVITNFEEHVASTKKFWLAASTFDWMLIQSDRDTPQELANKVCDAVNKMI